jgi:hypothetical protein
MAAPEVWVTKDDGSDLVRAEAIAAVGHDYTGTVTARLCGGEGSAVTLVTVASHEANTRPMTFTASSSGSWLSWPTRPRRLWSARYGTTTAGAGY